MVFEKAGVNALPIVSLISVLMGLVLAFEGAQTLEMFGAQIFIANGIGIVMIREFSPIFTAIIFAGRSGSAFAAEIGTMKVNEELNALETMGLDPIRFLVIQRVLAGTLLMPVLAAYSMVAGVFGGILVMFTMGFTLRPDLVPAFGAPSASTTCSSGSPSASCSARSSRASGACGGCRRRRGPTRSATRRPAPSSPGSS